MNKIHGSVPRALPCPALQELERALSCKYVASNAVTALHQVYQVSANRPGQKAKALQAWARILLKPELGRVTEACHLLEEVALGAIQQGGNYSQAQGKHWSGCQTHIVFSYLLLFLLYYDDDDDDDYYY